MKYNDNHDHNLVEGLGSKLQQGYQNYNLDNEGIGDKKENPLEKDLKEKKIRRYNATVDERVADVRINHLNFCII